VFAPLIFSTCICRINWNSLVKVCSLGRVRKLKLENWSQGKCSPLSSPTGGEHSLLSRKNGGGANRILPQGISSPLGDNFTPGGQLHPWGTTSPLGGQLHPWGTTSPLWGQRLPWGKTSPLGGNIKDDGWILLTPQCRECQQVSMPWDRVLNLCLSGLGTDNEGRPSGLGADRSWGRWRTARSQAGPSCRGPLGPEEGA
jgi:hypothetical protein